MAEDGGKRRSNIVVLSLLGLFTTVEVADAVIPEGVQMQRNVYTDRATCERDYPASQCQPGISFGSGRGTYFSGPYYSSSRGAATADDPGPGRAGAPRVTSEVSYRGGFGAFGRAIHVAA